jgi:hypothetical protein
MPVGFGRIRLGVRFSTSHLFQTPKQPPKIIRPCGSEILNRTKGV